MTTASGRLVYRPGTGRVIVVGYVAFAAWWLYGALTGPGLSWTAGAWLVTVGSVLYALFWRPAVVVDDEGVDLLNVVRDVRVPWACVEGIETRYALTLLTAGRGYPSWAASAPGRRSTLGQLARQGRGGAGKASEGHAADLPRPGWLPGGVAPDRSSRDLRSDSGAAAFMVEQAWEAWRARPRTADSGPDGAVPVPVVRWNVPVLAALVLPVAVAAVATLLHA